MRHKTLTWLRANLLLFVLACAPVGLVSGCGDGGGPGATEDFSEDAKKKAMAELEAEQKAMQGSTDYKKSGKGK